MHNEINIRHDLRPGDLGRLIALHGTAYEGEDNHFGLVFEAYVARTIAEYILDNKGQGRIWFAERADKLLATAAMVRRETAGAPNDAHGQLRWILADPSARGLGLGKTLVNTAMDYARTEGFSEVFLETTEGLEASMSIYRALGFQEVSRETQNLWLGENTVITMTKKL